MQLPTLNKSVTANGVAFHKVGQGPALLLVHGVGMCADSWYQQVNQLQQEFTVYAVDLPGHGQSQQLAAGFYSVALSHFVDVIADFAAEKIEGTYTVCGHSLGALIGAELAAGQPARVKQCLLLNAVYGRSESARIQVQNRAETLYQSDQIIGVEQTLDRWFGTPPRDSLHQYARMCRHWLEINSVSGYAKAYKAFADVYGIALDTAAKLCKDSVFMTGGQDPNSTAAMSERLAKKSQSYKAVIVEQAGHMLPITHANAVCDQLLLMK